MSILAVQTIESDNLSLAWGRALIVTAESNAASVPPLIVSVADIENDVPPEDTEIRSATDSLLRREGKYAVSVTAMTIFPWEIWRRRGCPPVHEFCKLCVDRLAPRFKARDVRNRNGIYFERMMAFEGIKRGARCVVNQLEFVIDLLKNRRRPRRSALQIGCFDPSKDHTGQPVRGFPCLQQVSISHDGGDQFALNAYYPTQYIFDRGYGNYLGLCHLGAFIAHEAEMKFVRLNCFVGYPGLGDITKRAIDPLVRRVQGRLGNPRQSEDAQ